MKLFQLPARTPILAVTVTPDRHVKVSGFLTTQVARYELEDLVLDPLSVRDLTLPDELVDLWNQNKYVFKLPANARGFTHLVVDGRHVEVL